LYTIHLRNVILHGKHGVYNEEHLLDAPFEINVNCYLQKDIVIHNLEDTLNYESVFLVVKKCFAEPQQLLEVLAKQIIETIKLHFVQVDRVMVQIYKLNAPIATLNGQVGVTVEY
jgi:7,8-dihydroneopterin aldolase/epimerase/oxygenase